MSRGALVPVVLLLGCTPERAEGPPLSLSDGVATDGEPTDPTVHRMFRGGPAHRGVTPEGVRLDGSLVEVWHTDALAIGSYRASKSSPAVDGDAVYVGLDDGRLMAFDRETGATRWSFVTRRAARERDPVPQGRHRGIHASPAVMDGVVFVGDYLGWLYALDAAIGDLVWEVELGDAIGASPVPHGPLVWTSVEYADPDGRVVAVDRATGAPVWRSPWMGEQAHGTPTLDVALDRVYVGANNGRFYAFDLSDGRAAWERGLGDAVKSTAALGFGGVYVTSTADRLEAIGPDGSRWFRVGAEALSMSSPAVDPRTSRVWFGAHDGRVRCVDGARGHLHWETDLGAPVMSSPVYVETGDLLVVGSHVGLHVLGASSGDVLDVPLDATVTGVPSVVDGSVFVTDDAGVTYRFDAVGP